MSFLFPNVECFRTILADPPWVYDSFGQAKHGAARNAYGDASELMSVDELAAIHLSARGAEPWAPFVGKVRP